MKRITFVALAAMLLAGCQTGTEPQLDDQLADVPPVLLPKELHFPGALVVVKTVYACAGNPGCPASAAAISTEAIFDIGALASSGRDSVQIEVFNLKFNFRSYRQQPNIVLVTRPFPEATLLAVFEDGVLDHFESLSLGGSNASLIVPTEIGGEGIALGIEAGGEVLGHFEGGGFVKYDLVSRTGPDPADHRFLAGALFGTDGSGGNLLLVNANTGAGTVVGPLGAGPVPSLAVDPIARIMYAGGGGTSPDLFTVDPGTGAASLVGSSGLGVAAIGGMDFRSDGTLFAAVNIAGGGGTGSDHLATIDQNTGAAAVIGPFGACTGIVVPSSGGGSCTLEGMEAIAFDAAGTLWGANSAPGAAGAPGMYTIDIGTGTASFVVPIQDGTVSATPPPGGVVSLQFTPAGALFAGTAMGRLIRINRSTGIFNFVGPPSATAGSSLAALAAGAPMGSMDSDNDGVNDDVDNCVATPNADQADADGDGIGDVCDPDSDNDGVNDDVDNCVLTPNADQADADGDGIGDVCDPDDDNDGVNDDVDNCPLVANADQADYNGDGLGDVCDPDDDNDGVLDEDDDFPMSSLAVTVIIDGNDTGVANQSLPSGANFSDLIGVCADGAGSHGQFVSCVDGLTDTWKDDGLIRGRDKGRIMSAVGRSR